MPQFGTPRSLCTASVLFSLTYLLYTGPQVPAEQCEAMVKQSFEKILEKECPSELEAFPAFPAPLCDKLKAKEDAVVTGVCAKQTKVPWDSMGTFSGVMQLPPFCEVIHTIRPAAA